ncbi:hypothetical protein GASC598I20_007430, partial [Gilliamella apicola SCGC AB-598-I20]
ANYGIHVQGIAYDTMLESYVLNNTAIMIDGKKTRFINF